MGQEDGHLTQTFTNQQLLATKYQGLDMLVDLLQECDDKWSRKLAQDASWGVAVDGKLQTILDLLGRSPQIGHSQTVADDKRGSYFGRYLITTQLWLLLMICRSRHRKAGIFFKGGVLMGFNQDHIKNLIHVSTASFLYFSNISSH